MQPANIPVYILVGGIITLSFLGLFFAYYQYRLQNKKLAESERKITQAETKIYEEPGKAKPVWDLARVTLEAYFNRNLDQINLIFRLSIIVMTFGFGIIIWGISRSINSPNIVSPALFATLTGVVTEFIGATYLFIYRSSIQQATEYTKTLERINSVGMAMQILDTMPDEAKSEDLKNRTKADLVKLLIQNANELPEDKHVKAKSI